MPVFGFCDFGIKRKEIYNEESIVYFRIGY